MQEKARKLPCISSASATLANKLVTLAELRGSVDLLAKSVKDRAATGVSRSCTETIQARTRSLKSNGSP